MTEATGTPHLKLIEDHPLLETPFLRVRQHRFALRRPDGRFAPAQERVVVDRGVTAAALLYEPAAHLIHLVRQFRFPTYDPARPEDPENGWLIELVAGIVEPGETPEASIIREVREETGFIIDAPKLIAYFFSSPGAFNEKIHLFMAEVSPDRRDSARNGHYGVDDEVITPIALTVSEFLGAVERLEIADAKTLIAAEWLRRRI